MTWNVPALIVAAYLIGSFDFAVVVARRKGLNIYEVGSGNPGTANVARNLGWQAAALVFVGDLLKGVVVAGLGLVVGGTATVGFGAGLAAAVGHCFPVWHRFRGGKGVATGAGVILVLAPVVALVLAGVWVVLARLARISSVASMSVVILAVPALAVAGHTGWSLVWVGLMMGLIVIRHRSNIVRLARGEERILTAERERPSATPHGE